MSHLHSGHVSCNCSAAAGESENVSENVIFPFTFQVSFPFHSLDDLVFAPMRLFHFQSIATFAFASTAMCGRSEKV